MGSPLGGDERQAAQPGSVGRGLPSAGPSALPPVLPSQLCPAAQAPSLRLLLLQRHHLRQSPGLLPRWLASSWGQERSPCHKGLSPEQQQTPVPLAVRRCPGSLRAAASFQSSSSLTPSPKSIPVQRWTGLGGERSRRDAGSLCRQAITSQLLGQVNPKQLHPARLRAPLACRRVGAEGYLHLQFTKQTLQGQARAPTRRESKRVNLGFVSCRVTHLEYVYRLQLVLSCSS